MLASELPILHHGNVQGYASEWLTTTKADDVLVDLSTGPTSLLGLLTAEIIRDVGSEGFTPQAISSAVAMSVGIYALIIGLLKLGFLLEFVSIPVLNGFISAVGIVIMLGQIPSLFGVKVGTGTATIIHDLFSQIPDFKGPTVGVGLGGIVLLVAMQKMGQRWGKKSKIIWLVALARSAIVLVLFTGISYGVNKNIDLENDDPVWELSKVKVRFQPMAPVHLSMSADMASRSQTASPRL